MKTTPLFLVGAVSLLSAATLYAESTVILESFEDSIDSVSQGDWGGPRIPDNVALSQYTKTGADDPNVTEGNKSLKVDLTGSEGWVLDFKVTLSDDASAKVHEALKSTDVGRYIVRYDMVFPGGTSWMNDEAYFGDLDYQLDTPDSANGGKQTMSFPLDFVTSIADDGSPIVMRFADNFDATEDPFVGPLTLYVDNIRLVDTYATGAKPVTYVLQSFEDSANPTGGAADFTAWGGTPRTTYSQYTATGPDDIRVSDGTHALKVDYAGPGDWKADFTLSFAGTKLADVLKLDLPVEQRPTPAQLARYTLRFDVTYPDRDENGKPAWEVTAFDTLAQSFPSELGRVDAATGQRETLSITLDQLTWSDTTDGKPVLMFIAQADWGDVGSTIYYDNFRLIDTAATGTPAAEIKITGVQFDAKTSAITLKWSSASGTNYAIDYTQTLGSWPTVLAASVAGLQGTTTYTGTVPSGTHGFLRVRPAN